MFVYGHTKFKDAGFAVPISFATATDPTNGILIRFHGISRDGVGRIECRFGPEGYLFHVQMRSGEGSTELLDVWQLAFVGKTIVPTDQVVPATGQPTQVDEVIRLVIDVLGRWPMKDQPSRTVVIADPARPPWYPRDFSAG